MASTRNRLYWLLTIACTAGYTWLLLNLYTPVGAINTSACIIKHVTNIPCPSCGATRSVLSLLHGHVGDAFYWNPIGILLVLLLGAIPLWLAFDVLLKKQTLFNFYQHAEKIIQQKQVAIPAVLLILLNWAWNIHKNL